MTPPDSRASFTGIALAICWFIVSVLILAFALPIIVLVMTLFANVLSSSPKGDMLFWCIFIVAALALGFLANRGMLSRGPCWVWIPGLLWLELAIWNSVRHYDPRWNHDCSATQNVMNAFFVLNSRKCVGGESPLAGLFFTLPAVSSIAYSIGAWIALPVGQRDNAISPAHSTLE